MKTISENMIQKTGMPPRRRAFTLIELLIVITIIGVLAGLVLGVSGAIIKNKKISTARGELVQIEAALENYKAKYGAYPPGNQNPATATYFPQQLNQLYYELSGTTLNGTTFTTLDGHTNITASQISEAYGVGGFINCTKGSGEDTAAAQNFLPGLKSSQIFDFVTNNPPGYTVPTTILVTSVGGPDASYMPLNATGLNPIRYVYPGVQNTGSYDLWVQLVISGKTNLVCNWSKATQVNTPFP